MYIRVLGALLATTVIWMVLRHIQARRRRIRLPPGPPGWPFIGSLFSWPSKERWLTFTEWGRLYGDLTYINLAGTDIIFVNSLSAAAAIFEVKSANFSDRPSTHFIGNLVGWSEAPTLLNYGPTLIGHRRRILQTIGSKRSLQTLESTMRSAALKCLKGIARAPQDAEKHVRMLTGTIILDISYGYEVEDENDKFVHLAETAVTELADVAMPGTFLVDAMPFLDYLPEWFPGTGYRKIARSMAKSRERLMNEPYNFTVQELCAGRAKHSFTATHLAAKEISPEEERLIQIGATMLYIAGSDTTVSSMITFILCMLLNPTAQQRAQEEIDKVIGHDRLPILADTPLLPYVEACINEALRSAPVVPEGLPHFSRVNDEHNGYFIPKGTIMIPNVWGIAHNPAMYSDPFSFRPERFLGSEPEPDPTFVFGFGKRVCPGRALAKNSMYMFATHLLALFDVKPARGSDGQELEVKPEYHSSTIIHPEPFPFECTPRSEKSAATFAAVLEA